MVDRDDMGQKTMREEIGMDLGRNRTSKSTHSKMSILFRCSSNPDDRRPSGFKIHFIAAKLQPPAQNLQIKVKKVKSWSEWRELLKLHDTKNCKCGPMQWILC